jgi:MSHA biogenesis protein MshM
MYLEHFKLSVSPFSLAPNTEFFCELPTHQEALNVLLFSLKQGDGFIKIIGEVGTGKTLLCRILLNKLDENFVTAYIPNPEQSGYGLRRALAHELGLVIEGDSSQLTEIINQRLLELHKQGKNTVLIVDESQALPDECLETIRLLTNLETEERKLLQVVLFGQEELETKLNKNSMRQLKQRIVFSYRLRPLTKEETNLYLSHRLAKAGHTFGKLFSPRAKKKLYRASHGLPRVLNVLCHKALLISYGRGLHYIDAKAVKKAIQDTESVLYRSKIINNFILFCCVAGPIITWCVYWKLGVIS